MSTAKVPIIDKSDPDLRLDDIPEINWVELKKDNKPYLQKKSNNIIEFNIYFKRHFS